MAMTASPTPRSYWTAVGVTAVLLLAAGLGFRVLAERLDVLSGCVPLPRGTLARLPLQIGDWAGEEVPMGDRVVRATDTDDHVNRTYRLASGTEAVSLWIAYGVRFRDLMPHRPEVCYPGNGWTSEGIRTEKLTTSRGEAIPVRILRFSQGGLGSDEITILNYYDVDGQYCPDVSLLRSRSWRPSEKVRYVAQVQIACARSSGLRSPEEVVRAFAREAAPVISSLLSDAVAGVAADAEHPEAGA